MPAAFHDRENATPEPANRNGRSGRGRSLCTLLAICAHLVLAVSAWPAAKLTFQTSGGVAIAGAAGAYTTSFGTMNALAFGTPQAGVSATALTNGAMYFTTLGMSVSSLGNPDTAVVKAFVSTNFTGSAASAMGIYGCLSSSACNSAGQFSALGTSLATQTTLASGITKNANTATIGLAIFLPDNDGASAFTNTVAAGPMVTFNLYINGALITTDVATLALNNSTVQSAVQLTLGTATGGLTIAPFAPLQDPFSMNFGNVNGLGIGPAPGLTTVNQAGGIIYSTPYNLLPIFTNINAISASIKVCVSTTFTHSAVLNLNDSATGSSGSFSNISSNCGSATSLTGSAGNRSTIARYLGLFVSNVNGATAFTGVDTASLTYTLTVP